MQKDLKQPKMTWKKLDEHKLTWNSLHRAWNNLKQHNKQEILELSYIKQETTWKDLE